MPERELVSSGSPYEPAIGFSRAVRVGNRVLVSGTAPVWPDGSMYLTDASHAGAVGRAHGEVLGHVRPVATMVVVAALLDLAGRSRSRPRPSWVRYRLAIRTATIPLRKTPSKVPAPPIDATGAPR